VRLKDATVKLIDFSTARDFGSSPMKTKICTLHYVAPEILVKGEVAYTEKVDVWSLGVVYFVMCCGVPPFDGDEDHQVLKLIRKGIFEFSPPDIWSSFSAKLKELISNMLVVDVKTRLTAPQVTENLNALRSPSG